MKSIILILLLFLIAIAVWILSSTSTLRVWLSKDVLFEVAGGSAWLVFLEVPVNPQDYRRFSFMARSESFAFPRPFWPPFEYWSPNRRPRPSGWIQIANDPTIRLKTWVFPAGTLPLLMWAVLRTYLFDTRRCRTCQYDLRGNASGVCPECGTPIPPGQTIPGVNQPGE